MPQRKRVLWIGAGPDIPSLSSVCSRVVTTFLAKGRAHAVFYYTLFSDAPHAVWNDVTLLPSFRYAADPDAAAGTGGTAALKYLFELVHPDVVITCGRVAPLRQLASMRRHGIWNAPWYHWRIEAAEADAERAIADIAAIVTCAAPVDADEFDLPSREQRSAARHATSAGSDFVVGSMARTEVRAGVLDFAARLSDLRAEIPDLRLLWVDDPQQREPTRFGELIASAPGLRHHRHSWIQRLEADRALNRAAMIRMTHAMDAFVNLSADEDDVASIDAACAGVPVVHARDSGWPSRLLDVHRERMHHDRAAAARSAHARHGSVAVGSFWAEALRPITSGSRPTRGVQINWFGTLFGSGSVNHCSREMALALDRCGADLTLEQPFARFENTVLFNSDFEDEYAKQNPSEHAELVRLIRKRPHDDHFTNIRFVVARGAHRAHELARSADVRTIEYSNQDHVGRLDDNWLRRFGEGQRWFAVSHYVRDLLLAAAGARGRDVNGLDIVPHGIDPSLFHPDVPPVAVPWRDRFVFMNCSFPRVRHKGLDLLCAAFAAEFRDEPVALVLKLPPRRLVVAPREYAEVERLVARTRERPGCGPVLIDETPTTGRADMAGWYAAADAYVHASRWEAFGLSVLESLATGTPLIASRWGGVREFCPEDLAYYVPCRPDAKVRAEAEPDLASLRRQMRYVFTHPEETQERAVRASAHVRQHFTWDQAARRMIKLLS